MDQVLDNAESLREKPLKRELNYTVIALFSIVTLGAVVGVPLFGFVYGYSALDWTIFGILYMVTGL